MAATTEPSAWIATARAIAEEAHADQVDKVGAPYIGHPARVAARLDPVTQPVAHAAAWLHDVLEDTDVDADALRSRGIPDDVVRVVELLTRTGDGDEYYARIRRDPVALAVKEADLADNGDPARTRLLDAETRERLRLKYEHARRALGLAPDGSA